MCLLQVQTRQKKGLLMVRRQNMVHRRGIIDIPARQMQVLTYLQRSTIRLERFKAQSNIQIRLKREMKGKGK